MRALHVIAGVGKAAGTSVFCGEIANEFAKRGHAVSIAVVDPTASDCYPLDPRINLVSIASVISESRSRGASDFDFVHIHALWSWDLHKISRWAHAHSIPIVWSPHGMITPWAMNNKRLKKLLGWHLYQKADLQHAALLHATAQSEVEDIRRMGLENKVVIAPLGVRIPPLCNRTIEQSEQSNNRKTLLFVSRVQRKKGLPNLIEAWSRLPQDLRAGWQIRIVGPEQDGHIAELKALCDQLGVGWHDSLSQSNNRTIEQSNIIFVGPKYGDELSAEYFNADLFVLPTHSENFGSVVIESLARGVPVICTKGAPWQELESHDCGRWIDIGVEPLTVALKELMSLLADRRKEMGLRGRKLVEEHYTWKSVADLLYAEYEKVVNYER